MVCGNLCQTAIIIGSSFFGVLLDGADVLLPNVEAEAMLGDKAYDATRVIKVLEKEG
jgi:hypothetical protein